ncbi:hypothetical protein O0L34_g9890 [Tuta absoluta]|nr:hypothetical protein O0L34_g9890 [Tuta absoluta]
MFWSKQQPDYGDFGVKLISKIMCYQKQNPIFSVYNCVSGVVQSLALIVVGAYILIAMHVPGKYGGIISLFIIAGITNIIASIMGCNAINKKYSKWATMIWCIRFIVLKSFVVGVEMYFAVVMLNDSEPIKHHLFAACRPLHITPIDNTAYQPNRWDEHDYYSPFMHRIVTTTAATSTAAPDTALCDSMVTLGGSSFMILSISGMIAVVAVMYKGLRMCST